MAKLELNLSEKVEKVEKVTIMEEAKFKDRAPCNWVIVATNEGIEAANNSSGETFSGSIEAFNKALRG
jgi:hypothetical protein